MLHDPTSFRDWVLAPPRRASSREIIGRVAAWYQLTPEAIYSSVKTQRLVDARFDAIAAVKLAYPQCSLPKLAMIFRRHHTTIYHALRVRGISTARWRP